MAQSKITLIGLEQFLNPDHSVFEQLDLPEGIDLDTLKGAIFLRCQEFELLYSNPDYMISAVKIWGMKNYWTFNKWIKLLDKEYDPLYNKDYYEDIKDTHQGTANSSGNTSESSDFTRTDNLSHSSDSTRTDNLTHTSDFTRTDNLHSTNDVTLTHSEKAFNDASYVGTTQDVTDQDGSNTGTQKNTGSETNTGTERTAGTETDTGTVRDAGSSSGTYGNTNSDSYTNNHTYHGYGNIGITSAQELFMKETDVARFNLYEQIADLFCNEFCIMVY